MNIPLINTNDKESINTSLIAIKRATEELNNLIKIADEKMAQLDEKAKKYTDDKINALDVASVGGSGKYISAISETDGKISATASDITSTVSSGNSQPVTSGGVADAIAYDYSYYVAGEETVFVIEIPYLNNNNSTASGSILISAKYGYRYILDFYAFINESSLGTTADRVGKIKMTEGAISNGNYLETVLKWDIDTTNKKIKFYLKKNSANTRLSFKLLQKYNTDFDIKFSTTTISVWNNAQYYNYFEYTTPIDSVTNGNFQPVTSNAVYSFHKSQLPDSVQYNTAPAKSWEEIGIILLNECQTIMIPVIDVGQFYNMGIFIALAVWTSGTTTAKNGSVFLLNHTGDNIIKLKANNGAITSKTRVILSSF